ncbi:MAG: hypothetical protein ACK4WJ_06540 [Endomicrobiia bacterium]
MIEIYGVDIIVTILKFLDLKNLLMCKQLNQYFKKVIENKEWHGKIVVEYGTDNDYQNWKKIIQKHNFINYIIYCNIKIQIDYFYDLLISMKKN